MAYSSPGSEDADDTGKSAPSDKYAPTAQEIDQVVQQGLASAAKGENIDHLLEVMCNMFPPNARGLVTKKFSAGLAKKKLGAPSNDPGIAPRSKLVRLYQMFMGIIQRQAVARVHALIRRSNQVASRVAGEGEVLAGKGTALGKEHLTGADLGTLSPSAGASAGARRKQSETRGV